MTDYAELLRLLSEQVNAAIARLRGPERIRVTELVPEGMMIVTPVASARRTEARSSVNPSPTAPKSLTETISLSLSCTVLVTAPVPDWRKLMLQESKGPVATKFLRSVAVVLFVCPWSMGIISAPVRVEAVGRAEMGESWLMSL